jgi:hypothetical protein
MTANNLPTPALYHDPRRQLRGMIAFHKRAEAAFLAVGKVEDAESARQAAEELQKELDKLEGMK